METYIHILQLSFESRCHGTAIVKHKICESYMKIIVFLITRLTFSVENSAVSTKSNKYLVAKPRMACQDTGKVLFFF